MDILYNSIFQVFLTTTHSKKGTLHCNSQHTHTPTHTNWKSSLIKQWNTIYAIWYSIPFSISFVRKMLVTAHKIHFMTLGSCNLQYGKHYSVIPWALSLAQNRCSINICSLWVNSSTIHNRSELQNEMTFSSYWHKI